MSWFAQLCEAVSFIHTRGITHCDLKLENIFLTDPDDTLKIGDFGLSLQVLLRMCPNMWLLYSTTLICVLRVLAIYMCLYMCVIKLYICVYICVS
jgi:serine/threonine protein kinase